jgi:hypothetical protein
MYRIISLDGKPMKTITWICPNCPKCDNTYNVSNESAVCQSCSYVASPYELVVWGDDGDAYFAACDALSNAYFNVAAVDLITHDMIGDAAVHSLQASFSDCMPVSTAIERLLRINNTLLLQAKGQALENQAAACGESYSEYLKKTQLLQDANNYFQWAENRCLVGRPEGDWQPSMKLADENLSNHARQSLESNSTI